jgi:hypothetical protein
MRRAKFLEWETDIIILCSLSLFAQSNNAREWWKKGGGGIPPHPRSDYQKIKKSGFGARGETRTLMSFLVRF